MSVIAAVAIRAPRFADDRQHAATKVDGQIAPGQRPSIVEREAGVTSRQRPAVNPWRHVATRQRHFHHAERTRYRIFLECGEDADTHHIVAALLAYAAFENCRWGA